MRKYLSIVLLVLMVSALHAQTDSLGIEERDGKVFVVHKVKSKQTLYSLARRYKTSVTEINNANPALANGLQVGQTLKIPFGGDLPFADDQPETTTVKETITHQVGEGETLLLFQEGMGLVSLRLKNGMGLLQIVCRLAKN